LATIGAELSIPAERPGFPGPADLLARREQLAAADQAGYFRSDPPARVETLGGIAVHRWAPPSPPRAALLHFHGGGFRQGSAAMMGPFAAAVAERCQVEVICPDYRLAPEFPFPAALNDARRVLAALRAAGGGPLIISGDSAGGALAAGLTALCVAEGATPLGLVLLSPWLDLTVSDPCYEANAATDPMFSRTSAQQATALYLQGIDPLQPLASPLFAALEGFPPTLLSIGAGEVLAEDGRRFHAALRKAGVQAELSAIAGMEHVAVTRGRSLVGASETFATVAAFIDGLTNGVAG
jgi:acetyl esterase/lipase